MTLFFSPVFGEFAVQRFQEADEYTVYVAFNAEEVNEFGPFAMFALDALANPCGMEPHFEALCRDLAVQQFAPHFAEMYVKQRGYVE